MFLEGKYFCWNITTVLCCPWDFCGSCFNGLYPEQTGLRGKQGVSKVDIFLQKLQSTYESFDYYVHYKPLATVFGPNFIYCYTFDIPEMSGQPISYF